MHITQLYNLLVNLSENAVKELSSGIGYHNSISNTRIRFPNYRKKDAASDYKTRISEQELRFIYTALLEKMFISLPITYSVETPTDERYSFSGDGSRSAASDMSLYENDIKICNIELKANQPSQDAVDKDIEKLCTENVVGVWSHLLDNTDAGTIRTLSKKFCEAYKAKSIAKHPQIFFISLLKQRVLLSAITEDVETLHNTPENFFNIELMDYKELPVGVHEVKGWRVFKF